MSETAPFDRPIVRRLFATAVIETRIREAERLNRDLRRIILDRKATDPGISRSNVRGWHSDTEMAKWGGAPARSIALATLQFCGMHTHDRGLAPGGRPRFEMGLEMWANVSPPGASNQMHAHPGCVWSAVYYVDDGGDAKTGKLVLHDPRFPMNRMAAPDLVFAVEGETEEMKFEADPEPGKLIAFPSWLMHSVQPHSGPRERISIAINIMALPARIQER
jgi:uncharacterized protein (TIGR02466 family)